MPTTGPVLNSAKISGTCGRLMCCLRYEHETYEEALKTTPPVGSTVKTPDGVGVVIETRPIVRQLCTSRPVTVSLSASISTGSVMCGLQLPQETCLFKMQQYTLDFENKTSHKCTSFKMDFVHLSPPHAKNENLKFSEVI